MMLMNKKGGEYVEASIVLPLLVLLIVSMIYAMMFFYGHADRQMKLHKVSLDKAKTSSSLFKKEKYKVEDRMDDLRRQIRGLKKINFRTLLDIQPVKEMVIVTFLAVLELMKVGEIKVSQEHNFAEIYLDSCE